MKTIRASEIGTYVYCQRAWWFQRQGIHNENDEAMVGGKRIHRLHGQAIFQSTILQAIAYFFILLALAVLTVYLVDLLA